MATIRLLVTVETDDSAIAVTSQQIRDEIASNLEYDPGEYGIVSSEVAICDDYRGRIVGSHER
jgi:hypothetical protein